MKPYIFLTVVISFLLASCNKGVDLSEVIDTKSPLELATLHSKEVINVHSKKWNQLLQFAVDNKDGWEETSALYMGTEIWLHQKGFNFRYYPSGEIATIDFKTNEGKEYKLAKKIESKEIAFLLD